MEDFDLLGHLHDVESSNLSRAPEEETVQLLLWKKLEINSYIPAARECHSSVSYDKNVYVFGGIEGSQRVNTTMRLNLQSLSWSLFKASGAFPSPRASHASAVFETFMIVQGGEGFQDLMVDAVQDEPQLDFPSSTLDGRGVQPPSKAVVGRMAGVCPGDTLQGLKMGPSLKVQKVPSQVTLALEQQQSAEKIISCFDDLYVLGLHNARWYEIRCNLAPLPRKGHTMSVVNLGTTGDSSKSCLLVFGGFSTDNLTVSNSILACSVEHVMKYIQRSDKILEDGKKISDYELQAGQQQVRRAFNADYDLQPVVWRTLPTKGTTPPGRFRHTSTVVKDNSGADLLIVLGGIGADAAYALNDVHILQCDTLTWMKLSSHEDGPNKGIGLEGPFNGIYGQVSFPYSSHVHTASLLDNAEAQGDESKEIIVFGGSYDTSSPKSSCYPYLFAYNYSSDTWRKVPTSHQYPMSRTGHSHAVVNGWVPTFDTPFLQPNSTAPISAAGKGTIVEEDFTRNSVIIFGGVTSAKMTNDTWALDLYLRSAGLDQYDNNTNQMIQTTMQGFVPTATFPGIGYATNDLSLDINDDDQRQHNQQNSNFLLPETSYKRTGTSSAANIAGSKTIHFVNDQKYLNGRKSQPQTNNSMDPKGRGTLQTRDLQVSQSMPTLSAPQLSTSIQQQPYSGQNVSFAFGSSGVPDFQLQNVRSSPAVFDGDESDTIMKFKRERAITEIQLCQERSRCAELEAQVTLLEETNNDLVGQLRSSSERYQSEIAELKKLLGESLRREVELKGLNEESNELLISYGLSRMQLR